MTKIRFAAANEAADLAVIHRSSFTTPWSEYQIERMFIIPGTFALVACKREPFGMILMRAVHEQADLMTIAVDPDFRRKGVGRQLLAHAMAECQRRGASQMFLEVAEDNIPAQHLYGNFNFKLLSHRKNYYVMPENRRTDALLMGCDLTEPLPPLS